MTHPTLQGKCISPPPSNTHFEIGNTRAGQCVLQLPAKRTAFEWGPNMGPDVWLDNLWLQVCCVLKYIMMLQRCTQCACNCHLPCSHRRYTMEFPAI